MKKVDEPDNATMIMATLLTNAKLVKFYQRSVLQMAYAALASIPVSPFWNSRKSNPDRLFSAFEDIAEKATQQFIANILLACSEDFLRSGDLEALVRGEDDSVIQVAMANIHKVLKKWKSEVFPSYLQHEVWIGTSKDAVKLWYEKLEMLMTGRRKGASLIKSWESMTRPLKNAFIKVEKAIFDTRGQENAMIRLARAMTTLVKEPELFFHRNPWAMLHEELVEHLKSMFDIDRLGIMDIIRKEQYESRKIPRVAVAEIGGDICGDLFFSKLFDFGVFQNDSEKMKRLNNKFRQSFGSSHLYMAALGNDERSWRLIPDVFRNDPLSSEGKEIWNDAFQKYITYYAQCAEFKVGDIVVSQSPKYEELDYQNLKLRCQKLIRRAGVNGATEDEFCMGQLVEKQPYCPLHLGNTANSNGHIYDAVKTIINKQKEAAVIAYGKDLTITMPKNMVEGFDFYVMQLNGVEERFDRRLAKLGEVLKDFHQFSLGSGDRNLFREEEYEMKYGCSIPYKNWWNCYISTKDKLSNLGHDLSLPWHEMVDFLRRISLSQGHTKVCKKSNNKYLILK